MTHNATDTGAMARTTQAGNKTKPTKSSVAAFVAGIENVHRRRDAEALLALMGRVTGLAPTMWGSSIIGYGSYSYSYASGRRGEAPAAGFSPRAAATTVYLVGGVDPHEDLLARLGPHEVGKACLYIKHIEDIDLDVLEEIVRRSYRSVDGDAGS